jgi:hypothetical protein
LSQLAHIQKSYRTHLLGYQLSQKSGQYQKSRKSQKDLTERKRKLDRSQSQLQFLSPPQFLQYQKYQLQFPTRGKQNDD